MAKDPQQPKNKGGRPKGKPLSAKERAQRRAAAVKTGEYASTALGQALALPRLSGHQERPG